MWNGTQVGDIWPPVQAHGDTQYVALVVTSLCCADYFFAPQLENGYAIWDFRGQELEKHILDRFKQFIWRPRPRSLLTKDQQRQIRKNLREYSRAFDEEDAVEESNVSAELIAHRKRLLDEWNAWRARCKRDIAEEKRSRGQKLNGEHHEEEKEEIEEWIDEVIEQIEEEVVE
jgi:translation initiation factor 3 subunit B